MEAGGTVDPLLVAELGKGHEILGSMEWTL